VDICLFGLCDGEGVYPTAMSSGVQVWSPYIGDQKAMKPKKLVDSTSLTTMKVHQT